MKSKFLISLIVFFIIISSVIPAFAENKTFNTYLALGDSIAEGYGLKNTEEGYTYLVKEAYKIDDNNFKNMAITGTTTKAFNKQIRTEEYSNAIKNADLITISMGSNETLEIVQDLFLKTSGIKKEQMHDLESFNQILSEKLIGDNKMDSLKNAYKIIDEFYNQINSLKTEEELEEAINQYKIEWNDAINYIKQINSNATIIVSEFYNPYYNVNFIHDFGEAFDKYIRKMNDALYEVSENESKYKIAKIYEPFNNDEQRLTNFHIDLSDLSSASVDPHPNKLGQETIANKFIEAIETNVIQNQAQKNIGIYIAIPILVLFAVVVIIIAKKRKV